MRGGFLAGDHRGGFVRNGKDCAKHLPIMPHAIVNGRIRVCGLLCHPYRVETGVGVTTQGALAALATLRYGCATPSGQTSYAQCRSRREFGLADVLREVGPFGECGDPLGCRPTTTQVEKRSPRSATVRAHVNADSDTKCGVPDDSRALACGSQAPECGGRGGIRASACGGRPAGTVRHWEALPGQMGNVESVISNVRRGSTTTPERPRASTG